ncbi:hypothetical protein [Mesorhizobium sp. IMUNJ 23232]|uniref:hypothetical protein n=1 Tax=Mesorhizobium sp. IMUNJ 23232 TaxID=3376064 RepID=UPI00378C7648
MRVRAPERPFSDKSATGALGIKEWSYLAPIFVGDTLHIEVKISAKKLTSDGSRYIVDRDISVVNQTGKLIQKGTARSMWRRASTEPAGA